MKRILIACAYFFPQNSPRAFRATELPKEFARQGHEVLVVTTDKGCDARSFCRRHGIQLLEVGELFFKPMAKGGRFGLGIVRRILRRLLMQLFEFPTIQYAFKFRSVVAELRGYDMLISVAVPYPVHWGIAAIANLRAVTKVWVADCGDPYMGCKTDSFRKMPYFSFVEKWFCRRASFITVPTAGSLAGYYPEFREKMRVIPQGVSLTEFDVVNQDPSNPVPTFAYAGAFIPGKRDPRKLLSYLVSLQIDFVFVVYTNMAQVVEPYARRSNGRIIISPTIPRHALIQALRKMDFLINFENGTNIQTPSKLIDYRISNRPVLSVRSDVLDENTINEFLARNYRNSMKLPDLEHHDIANVVEKFLTLLDEQNSE